MDPRYDTKRSRRPSDGAPPKNLPGHVDGVRRGTGHTREEWFSLLDHWSAADHPYREIADWLRGDHQLSDWWAQKVAVEYQQARGRRPRGLRPDGTFEVSASRTLAVPVGRLEAALLKATFRERWLPGAVLDARGSETGRSTQFDWDHGASRLSVAILAKDKTSSLVSVHHSHLPDAETAGRMKAYWRERLSALKALLEG